MGDLPVIRWGDPALLGECLDRAPLDDVEHLVPAVEQIVAHFRAAGWSDLAIGTQLTRIIGVADGRG